tara:strand:- start:3984 stop:4145 length:162 start_codon:yes stop_codon:yes gene_type:complete
VFWLDLYNPILAPKFGVLTKKQEFMKWFLFKQWLPYLKGAATILRKITDENFH